MPKFEFRRGGHSRNIAACAAAIVSLSAALPARADVTDQLLDQLRANGVLTRGEYSQLKSRHKAEKARMSRGDASGHRSTAQDGVLVVPDDRYLTRLDKGIGFRIPGSITKDGEIGGIDVKLNGDLIFYGTESFPRRVTGSAISGGVLGGLVDNSTNIASNGISSALLPSSISLNLNTNQLGYDLGFKITAFVGGGNTAPNELNANGPGSPIALGTPGIDLRQVFGTVGTPTFGTVKIGRDLGLFGGDAILNDESIFGVGTAANIAKPTNTTLGRIGIGYVYADWIPQITYTTPDFNGFTASIGAFTPLDTADIFTGTFSGEPVSANVISSEAPMVQGRVKWVGSIVPGANLTVSADGLWQEHRVDHDVTDGAGPTDVNLPNGAALNSWAIDGFSKIEIDGFSFIATGYYGVGLGTTGLFLDAYSLDGSARTSFGGYGQATYTWDKFKFGGSWGISEIDANGFDVLQAYGPFLLKSNESAIGFVRYQLTQWMTIEGEYVHSWATNQSGGRSIADQIDFGTAWFF